MTYACNIKNNVCLMWRIVYYFKMEYVPRDKRKFFYLMIVFLILCARCSVEGMFHLGILDHTYFQSYRAFDGH